MRRIPCSTLFQLLLLRGLDGVTEEREVVQVLVGGIVRSCSSTIDCIVESR